MTYEEKLAFVNSSSTLVEWINNFEAYIIRNSLEKEYRPKNPFFISWNLTNTCNLACKYCSNACSFTTLNEMDLQDKLKTIDVLVNNGVKHIRLLGGEPSVVLGFPQIIDAILQNNIFLSFSSNGIGITEELMAVLRKYSPHMYKINISCDSCIEENNDANRGKNSYKNANVAINRLLTIPGVDLTFFSVLTNATKKDIIPTYNYLKKLGVSGYGISVALKKGRATDEDIISAKDIIDDVIWVIEDSKNSNITSFFSNLGYYKNENYDENYAFEDFSENECDIVFREKCNCCITRLHVESNGDIYPCDHLKFPPFLLGNILKKEFVDIWNNEITQELAAIRRKDKEVCQNCKFKACTTGCMGLAYEKYGSFYRKDPNCGVMKK